MKLVKFPVSTGLGTLDISFNRPVPLYLIEDSKEPFDTLSFEKQLNGTILFKTNYIRSLHPYRMNGGSSDKEIEGLIRRGLTGFPAELSFRVLEATDNFFRIVVNEKTFETAVIKKDCNYAVFHQRNFLRDSTLFDEKIYKGYYIFETWEHLLRRAEYVNFNIDYDVCETPNGKIIYKHKAGKFLPYTLVDVKGDWIKVKKTQGREFNFEGIENAEGWVKWKNDKKVLVNITENTIE